MSSAVPRPEPDASPAQPRRAWLVLAGGFVVVHAFFLLWPQALFYAGLRDYGVRFLDLFAILASNDALARGLDVHAMNPLDYLQRSHVYSHWWLHLGKLGLTRADNGWLGLAVVVAFGAVVLATLRPRSAGEAAWYLALGCSPPVLLAVNRANNDLIVFLVLAAVVPCLARPETVARLGAVLAVAVAAALKYYPAAAAVVVFGGAGRREIPLRAGLTVLALVAVGLGVAADLAAFGVVGPKPTGLLTFGAANLPGVFGVTGPTVLVLAGGWLGVGWVLGWRWAQRYPDTTEWAGRPDGWRFVLGAILLAGCFVAGKNYAYRWIFALWLAPLLWQQGWNPGVSAGTRSLARITGGALLAAVWLGGVVSLAAALAARSLPLDRVLPWVKVGEVAEQLAVWVVFAGCALYLGGYGRSVWVAWRRPT